MGGLGPLSGPMWAVLGRSWGVCGRSWAALGTAVGRLGPLLGPLWAVLAALGAYVGGLGLLLGAFVGGPGRVLCNSFSVLLLFVCMVLVLGSVLVSPNSRNQVPKRLAPQTLVYKHQGLARCWCAPPCSPLLLQLFYTQVYWHKLMC